MTHHPHPWPLERLHTRLGRPAWYWPALIAALFIGAPLLAELIERSLP